MLRIYGRNRKGLFEEEVGVYQTDAAALTAIRNRHALSVDPEYVFISGLRVGKWLYSGHFIMVHNEPKYLMVSC